SEPVAAVSGLLAGSQHGRDRFHRRAAAAGRQSWTHFRRGQPVDGYAARIAQVGAHERVHAIVRLAAARLAGEIDRPQRLEGRLLLVPDLARGAADGPAARAAD